MCALPRQIQGFSTQASPQLAPLLVECSSWTRALIARLAGVAASEEKTIERSGGALREGRDTYSLEVHATRSLNGKPHRTYAIHAAGLDSRTGRDRASLRRAALILAFLFFSPIAEEAL